MNLVVNGMLMVFRKREGGSSEEQALGYYTILRSGGCGANNGIPEVR